MLLYTVRERWASNLMSPIANPQIRKFLGTFRSAIANRKFLWCASPQIANHKFSWLIRKSQARNLNKYIVQLCLKTILKVVFLKQIFISNKLILEHYMPCFQWEKVCICGLAEVKIRKKSWVVIGRITNRIANCGTYLRTTQLCC